MAIEKLIGNTPLVKSVHLNSNPNVSLYFKLEGQNPGGSIKDRAAYYMIKGALERDEISKESKPHRSYLWKYRNCLSNDLRAVWSFNRTCHARKQYR